jgi:hypothetical protein
MFAIYAIFVGAVNPLAGDEASVEKAFDSFPGENAGCSDAHQKRLKTRKNRLFST